MTERAASRPWSEQEDALLRQAVAQYGENDNWKIIALSVSGRTNKACRKRWLHSLQPNVKKSAWTPSEDSLLLELYGKHGPKWSMIARQISGRTDDACSKRYREALDPSLKKDQWTPDEDEKLMEAYNRIGGKWGQVGQELQRSGLGCRNRWRLLERKKLARVNQSLNSPAQALHIHELSPHAAPVELASPLQDFSHELVPNELVTVQETHWPPYYPPEAYPTLTSVEDNRAYERPFHIPTPPPLDIPNPEVAPFQFSSSSLSAALSNPPPRPRPLPPISAQNTPELSQDTLHDVEDQTTLSPLTHINAMPEMNDVLMTLDTLPQINLASPHSTQLSQLQVTISQPPYEQENFFSGLPFPDGSFPFVSPISLSNEISQHDSFLDMWKPRYQDEFEFDSPRSLLDGFGFADFNEGFSSSSSTPFLTTHALSPTASPNPLSFSDLPNPDFSPSTGSSLLFSTSDTQNSGSVQRSARSINTRKHRPSIKLPVPTRLSSSLPFTNNPSIQPYACGRPSCWPAGETSSSSCFVTSGELQDHAKDKHSDEEAADKPFRCALAGCGKSWKSINGLQYHLQISTVHFTNAIQDKFSKQPATPVQQMSMLSTEGGDSEDSDRRYPCPTPGCYKAYRQPSGLRYHIKHGHPADLPTQLNFVPPALERQLPAKAKKMRPKPIIEVTGGFPAQMEPTPISST
ncbi:hypothetical protein CPB83DRAFT_841584 [Crepidotus variabilis]|uniref:Uncharacterized protein n=1 Tax=Crepidotus variabilis TaxID=179855 RepID=A0A9P6EUR5_9AGAR|nr:hypothetical protein CPB83DRAFT_841584 [Crepidotus variabilis]